MNNLKLLHKHILVKRLEPSEQTQTGLFLPSAARELPQLGRIVHCGSKVVDLKPNDLVLTPKFWDIYITIGDQTFLHLNESDILAHIMED